MDFRRANQFERLLLKPVLSCCAFFSAALDFFFTSGTISSDLSALSFAGFAGQVPVPGGT
jgi:hypothetical protein